MIHDRELRLSCYSMKDLDGESDRDYGDSYDGVCSY